MMTVGCITLSDVHIRKSFVAGQLYFIFNEVNELNIHYRNETFDVVPMSGK
jgi:hypothetical protein